MTTKHLSNASERLRPAPAPPADLRAALAAEIRAKRRQPGDVDTDQLMDDTGLSRQAVRAWMRRRVAASGGRLTSLMVYDPDLRREVRVWRTVVE